MRMTLPVCVGLLLALAGCPEGATVDDGGPIVVPPVMDAGVRQDAGAPPLDAGLPDVPPPTADEVAFALCEAYWRGTVQIGLSFSQSFALSGSRCSNDDAITDILTDPELAMMPPGTCTLGDATRRMFQSAATGGRVQIDLEAFRACVALGREQRANHATLGAILARTEALESQLLAPVCQDALRPLVPTGGLCEQAWDCIAPSRCEADPIDGNVLRCLLPALEGARCVTEAPEQQLPARTCSTGNVCLLDICTRRIDLFTACDPLGVPCVEGAVCSPEQVCEAPRAEGEACTDDTHCREGLFCTVDGLCEAPEPGLLDGDLCGPDLPACGGTCSVCRPDAQGALRCQDRGGQDAPCLALNDCQAAFFCEAGQDAGPSHCTRYGAAGAACDGQTPCGPGLVCTAALPPGVDAGPPPVDAGPDGPSCRSRPGIGEGCDAVYRCIEGTCWDGVCLAGDVDEPCNNDNQCLDDLICVRSICQPPPRIGAPCSLDGRCTMGAYCDGDRCKAFPTPGMPCTPDQRCADGAFCDEGTCEALRVPGAPCVADEMCSSDLCLDTGTCATRGASCDSAEEVFIQIVSLSVLVPLIRLRRRRRRG